MPQKATPFLFMRGGTSRGPFFNSADLPEDREALADFLIHAVGAGHPLNIDGIGGGNAVTTKVAMLSPSDHDWAEIDYFFAQVSVEKRTVDFKPSCGNMLAGVGPAAIEMGLIPAGSETTKVCIRNTNTEALIEAEVQTPGGMVEYAGEARIDGVPGTAAPVLLNFMEVIGSKTGALLPTGNAVDTVGGVEVTLIDVAVPMVMGRAKDFGLSGYETKAELDANKDYFARMEAIRIEAGALMGLGDVSESVVPKFAVLAEPKDGGTVAARYFMPWDTHPAMAVTGSICIGACCIVLGTVAEGISDAPETSPAPVQIEHPMGAIDVAMSFSTDGPFQLNRAGVLRTARKLASGEIFVP